MTGSGSQETPAVDPIVEKLREQLRKLETAERDEWLRLLYDRYTERFMKDNDRIWSTGAIMIPLSLGGFVALATIQVVTVAHVLSLALASIALMLFWEVTAENHRAFQQKSEKWIKAIEEEIGLTDTGGPKADAHRIAKLRVQAVRWYLFGFTVLCWLIVGFLFALGYFPP